MTITLGTITISNNMYLSGIESAARVSVDSKRTIEGNHIVSAKSIPGGTEMTLGTQNRSGANQGIWCSEIIDQVKDLELQAQPVTLDYRGTTYNVLITGTTFTPLFQWEEEGPYKKFTGTISLLEV